MNKITSKSYLAMMENAIRNLTKNKKMRFLRIFFILKNLSKYGKLKKDFVIGDFYEY